MMHQNTGRPDGGLTVQHDQHCQSSGQQLQLQGQPGDLETSLDDAILLAAINASQQQYHQGGSKEDEGQLQLRYLGPAGVSEEAREHLHHPLEPAVSHEEEEPEMPPRPSSDDDVIRAAAEAVARDNLELPIEGGEEFFAEDASGTGVLVANELTNDEVASLAGFDNVGNLNSLVSYVSETCLSGNNSNEPETGASDHEEEGKAVVQEARQSHKKPQQGPHTKGGCFLKEGSQDPVLTATADTEGSKSYKPHQDEKTLPPSTGMEVCSNFGLSSRYIVDALCNLLLNIGCYD